MNKRMLLALMAVFSVGAAQAADTAAQSDQPVQGQMMGNCMGMNSQQMQQMHNQMHGTAQGGGTMPCPMMQNGGQGQMMGNCMGMTPQQMQQWQQAHKGMPCPTMQNQQTAPTDNKRSSDNPKQ